MGKEPLTFERAMARLEEIVAGIEQGRIGLEESIERFEEGMSLVRRCREVLASAELKIQKLQADSAGDVKAEDVPDDAADGEMSF